MARLRLSITALLAAAVAVAGSAPAGGQGPIPGACNGRTATITGTPLGEVIEGTAERDVIDGGGGNDIIRGDAGGDLICGGEGDDLIQGELGSDRGLGGTGVDRLLGGRGNDELNGGIGDGDEALGEVGDDEVRGGPGSDFVWGGLGIDVVSGGRGANDLVVGGYGYDEMSGGPGGGDVASFATAVSGQQGPDGVSHPPGIVASLRTGKASGDGLDTLRRFEGLEGSAFGDVLIGDRRANLIEGGPGGDFLRGGGGVDRADGATSYDRCVGFATRSSCESSRRPQRGGFVLVDPTPLGGGSLTLVGSRSAEVIDVQRSDDPLLVQISGAPPRMRTGPGCERVELGIECNLTPGPMNLVIDLGPGGDELRVWDPGFAGELRYGGGDGDDQIAGTAGNDLIEAGSGADTLIGRNGTDGLVGGFGGPDKLRGGAGDDLIAPAGPCAGGLLVGWDGRDNASFAEAPAHPGVMLASLRRGIAFVKAAPRCRPVRISDDFEDIEGTFDNDVVVGDGGDNGLLGQPGRDRLYGLGGRDRIDAFDKRRDIVISCGRGGGSVRRDRFDPRPMNCN